MGKIRENVLTESNIRALVKMVDEEMDGVAKEQRQKLETIEAELVDVKRRLGRLYDLAETTDLDIDDFKPRIREHRERQERLEATAAEARAMLSQRREVLDDVETITAYTLDMSMFLNESELTERRAFIESFVKEIVVMPDNAVVRYTIPMPDDSPIPGRDVEEMALNGSVLSTVKYGGPKLTVDSTIFEMWRDCELPRVCQPTAVDARYKWWQYPTRMCYLDSSLLTVSSVSSRLALQRFPKPPAQLPASDGNGHPVPLLAQFSQTLGRSRRRFTNIGYRDMQWNLRVELGDGQLP